MLTFSEIWAKKSFLKKIRYIFGKSGKTRYFKNDLKINSMVDMLLLKESWPKNEFFTVITHGQKTRFK